MRRLIHILIPLLLLMGLWEVAGHFERYRFVLPPPSHIAEGLWNNAGRFLLHSRATLREMVGGVVLAVVLALPLAWVLLVWRKARHWLHPLVIISQCLPMMILAPLMVIWFGWSYTAVVLPTVLILFFPLTLNIYQGFKAVPQEYLQAFELWGATPFETLWRCRLPWALPQICAGGRIAAGLAGSAAIVAEWAGAQEGLGVLMLESRRAADLITVFGAIFCVVVLSVAVYGVAVLVEHLTLMRRPLTVIWRQRSGRKRLLGLGGLATLLAASCINPLPTIQHAQGLRLVLDWLPNPNHVALFAGAHSGIFARHGIALDILKVQEPGDVIPYLTSGVADLAVTYMPSLILGAERRGANLNVAGYLIKEPLVALISRKEVDLATCTIGCATDGVQTQMLEGLLQRNGILSKRILNISFDLVSALVTGQVDAIFGAYWNIEGEHLRQWNVEVEWLTMKELGTPHHFELVIVAQRELPASFISRFRNALQEAIQFSTDHPDQAFALYAAANPDKTAKTLEWEHRSWNATIPLLATNQDDELEVWDHYREWLVSEGLL